VHEELKKKEFKSSGRSVMWDCALVSVLKTTVQNSNCDVTTGDGTSSESENISINRYVTRRLTLLSFM
jgi:hypothetical protein